MRRLAPFLFCASLLGATGCQGAYGRALERGDRFAAAGQWDDAAEAYEEALDREPRDAEAKLRLQRMRQRQIEVRLAQADVLAQRGDVRGAFQVAMQAVHLDPQSLAAQRGVAQALDAMVAAAEARRQQGQLEAALALLREVEEVSPEHRGARQLGHQVRDAVAGKVMARALAHEQAGRLGVAHVEAVRACRHACSPEREEHGRRIRQALTEALIHRVVASVEGMEIVPAAIREAVDAPAPFLAVAAQGDGASLSAVVGEVSIDDDHRPVTRTCEYVCGKEWRPNPRVQQLRDEAARADRDLSRQAEEVARREAELLRAEQGVTSEEQSVQQAQERVDEARERLEKCKGRWAPNRSSPCSSEQSTLRQRQRDLERARRGTSRERGDVKRARDRVEQARRNKLNARRRRDRAQQELLRTPERVEVERRCPFSYPAELHRRVASAPLRLDGEEGSLEVVAEDDTFAPVAGHCASLASGDPLELPDEAALRARLRARLTERLAERALASYDEVRRARLAEARAAEARGDLDGAVDAYVRYFLLDPTRVTDPHPLELLGERHDVDGQELRW